MFGKRKEGKGLVDRVYQSQNLKPTRITFRRLENRNNKGSLQRAENNVQGNHRDLHEEICEPLELGSEATAVDCS